MHISFTLNGEPADVAVGSSALMVDVIRDLGLTGTKEACGVGVCGLCTILVNELPVSSCIYLAACAAGADVWTVEGLALRDVHGATVQYHPEAGPGPHDALHLFDRFVAEIAEARMAEITQPSVAFPGT